MIRCSGKMTSKVYGTLLRVVGSRGETGGGESIQHECEKTAKITISGKHSVALSGTLHLLHNILLHAIDGTKESKLPHLPEKQCSIPWPETKDSSSNHLWEHIWQ
jgi:hypothetical protein